MKVGTEEYLQVKNRRSLRPFRPAFSCYFIKTLKYEMSLLILIVRIFPDPERDQSADNIENIDEDRLAVFEEPYDQYDTD